MQSYNTKNGDNLNYEDYPEFDSNIIDYNLYLPHSNLFYECFGYLLSTKKDDNELFCISSINTPRPCG